MPTVSPLPAPFGSDRGKRVRGHPPGTWYALSEPGQGGIAAATMARGAPLVHELEMPTRQPELSRPRSSGGAWVTLEPTMHQGVTKRLIKIRNEEPAKRMDRKWYVSQQLAVGLLPGGAQPAGRRTRPVADKGDSRSLETDLREG